MEFRPCIDIHDGQVKQIVGGSLKELPGGNAVVENFVSKQDAAFYARLYQQFGIRGGHVILLNPVDSEQYKRTKEQALAALSAYPGGLQAGGGITPENAGEFLDAGASHVIVTSYVFQDGKIHYDRLEKLKKSVGKERLVLDLSCRKVDGAYRVVTNRWQKVTEEVVDLSLLDRLFGYCDEFLVHAVDVEGKARGIETNLVEVLGRFEKCQVTYAGGVHNFADLELLKQLGQNRVNVTIGSALDLFGGAMEFQKVLEVVRIKK